MKALYSVVATSVQKSFAEIESQRDKSVDSFPASWRDFQRCFKLSKYDFDDEALMKTHWLKRLNCSYDKLVLDVVPKPVCLDFICYLFFNAT